MTYANSKAIQTMNLRGIIEVHKKSPAQEVVGCSIGFKYPT
jgi:hypothetical protein